MLQLKTTFYFFFFILFFFSCSNGFDPEGVWISIDDPKQKIIALSNEPYGIALRKKNGGAWRNYRRTTQNNFFGTGVYDVSIISSDTLIMKRKETEEIKKYFKSNQKTNGAWAVNIRMPKETVRKFLGEPDEIIQLEKEEEKWVYGEHTRITFNELGVKDFSDKYKKDKNFNVLQRGMKMEEVLNILGVPDNKKSTWNSFLGTEKLWIYENGKIVKFKDGKMSKFYPNFERYEKLQAFKEDAMIHQYDFEKIDTSNIKITVNENGKIVEELKMELYSLDTINEFEFIGEKYWLFITHENNKGFRIAYNRKTKKKGLKYDHGFFDEVDIKLDRNLIPKGILTGNLKAKIEEKKARNTIIEGTFLFPLD